MKNKKELSKIRKKARTSGRDFELRVRKDLEEKGWIVDKWGKNVEFEDLHIMCGESDDLEELQKRYDKAKFETGKLIQTKNKWAGPNRPMMMGAGFPDFIAFDNVTTMNNKQLIGVSAYEGLLNEDSEINLKVVIGVEAKTDGYLDKIEREKCKWLLENKIFSKILVASKHKAKNRVVIEYREFKDEK